MTGWSRAVQTTKEETAQLLCLMQLHHSTKGLKVETHHHQVKKQTHLHQTPRLVVIQPMRQLPHQDHREEILSLLPGISLN